jgi:F-type H+-transporting ATPase subunit b|tara:strand:+ start:297 stop:773 length:477 start_codon:yes stop_codon:yes gene_type:complete
MNEQIFILLAQEGGPGGLFDIGATLPLVALQFLVLMFILNSILYNPLITLMNQRNEYILDNLSKASEMLITAEELTTQYETELASTKKEAQQEISQLKKVQKESFDNELSLSQKSIDTLVGKILENFAAKKETVLAGLGSEIDSLSNQMVTKLFTQRA